MRVRVRRLFLAKRSRLSSSLVYFRVVSAKQGLVSCFIHGFKQYCETLIIPTSASVGAGLCQIDTIGVGSISGLNVPRHFLGWISNQESTS